MTALRCHDHRPSRNNYSSLLRNLLIHHLRLLVGLLHHHGLAWVLHHGLAWLLHHHGLTRLLHHHGLTRLLHHHLLAWLLHHLWLSHHRLLLHVHLLLSGISHSYLVTSDKRLLFVHN